MSKKQAFIEYIKPLFEKGEIPEDVNDYWIAFTMESNSDKPPFTENGKRILKFLQENLEVSNWKAKDIAEGLNISSRGVSGAARKLATDGYLEKIGKDPIYYCLTEKGKNTIINEEN